MQQHYATTLCKKIMCLGLVVVGLTMPMFAVADPILAKSPISTAPDGKVVVDSINAPPHCASGCDIAEDCRNNEKNPLFQPTATEKWSCINKPGFCVGTCRIVLK